MLLVTGCGVLTPKLVIEHQVHYVYEPEYLQHCSDAPSVPMKSAPNSIWGDYILDLDAAGADCRDKVAKGKQWQDQKRSEEQKRDAD